MKRLTLLAAGLLAFSGVASANDDRQVAGLGYLSCGEYVAVRKENPRGEKVNAYVSWLFGYLSAYNLVNEAGPKKFKQLPDLEAALIYMDNYCQAHPLDQFWHGGENMYFELPTRNEPVH